MRGTTVRQQTSHTLMKPHRPSKAVKYFFEETLDVKRSCRPEGLDPRPGDYPSTDHGCVIQAFSLSLCSSCCCNAKLRQRDPVPVSHNPGTFSGRTSASREHYRRHLLTSPAAAMERRTAAPRPFEQHHVTTVATVTCNTSTSMATAAGPAALLPSGGGTALRQWR